MDNVGNYSGFYINQSMGGWGVGPPEMPKRLRETPNPKPRKHVQQASEVSWQLHVDLLHKDFSSSMVVCISVITVRVHKKSFQE